MPGRSRGLAARDLACSISTRARDRSGWRSRRPERSVVLVESFAPASAQAAAAARAQGLDVETVCGDAATALRARAERWRAVRRGRRQPATARDEPPGARGSARSWIPPTIAYVSCDPDTLARDLAHLARLGYAAASLHPLDMIPLTDEVETVAILRRAAIPPPPVRLRGRRGARRRQGSLRADGAAGRVRRVAARAECGASQAPRRRSRCSGPTSGRAASWSSRAARSMWRSGSRRSSDVPTRTIHFAAVRGHHAREGADPARGAPGGQGWRPHERATAGLPMRRPQRAARGGRADRRYAARPRSGTPGVDRPPGPGRRAPRPRADQPVLRGEVRSRSHLPALRAARARAPGLGGAARRSRRRCRATSWPFSTGWAATRPCAARAPRSDVNRAVLDRTRECLACACQGERPLREHLAEGRKRGHEPVPLDDRLTWRASRPPARRIGRRGPRRARRRGSRARRRRDLRHARQRPLRGPRSLPRCP